MDFFSAWLLGGIMVLSVRHFIKEYRECRQMLHECAVWQGYKIVDASCVLITLPWKPFYWKSNHGYVFRFTVADSRGETKSGYAFCPSFYGCLFGEKMDITWDRFKG